MQYHHLYAKNAYNEIEMTFDALLEQQLEAGLREILLTETKSSLELKYGHLRAGINKICGVLLCYEKFSLTVIPSGKKYFFGLK